MRKSLTKLEILKKQSEIDKAFKNGKATSRRGLKLILAPNNLNRNRIIVIPVKHYGNAVERNRIRRRIKEIWRKEKEKFISGNDFIFLVYPGKVFDSKKLEQVILELCDEQGIYLNK
ncbi:MAG: ribonuclease P protein component [Sphaerochaetaceae bacterium]|nr:ribonuclease P protein component [Sphaerochaetaceae bacterium]MDC7236473.1 ribonuclease P protein component [Sphaerochaetaceae bacterium]MDC7249154.1 ribonuclease P protein component [Sphaerochaetaceae bacterium]